MKSIQLMLNEWLGILSRPIVSAAAYTKARQKILHTAFIELNQKAVVETVYTGSFRTFQGLRVLAVDGSKIILPNSQDIVSVFGVATARNQHTSCTQVYSIGLASVLYDVMNGVALAAHLAPETAYEVTEAERHLVAVQEGDIVLFDRGYCSYRMMASVLQTQAHFMIRCHATSFTTVRSMLRNEGSDDVIETIQLGQRGKKARHEIHLPESITVRFTRVVLDTGEIEVLATSLFDTVTYPPSILKELYWKRWGIETFYGTLKTRLCLENFSGTSVEAVRQEFHATIFLTGLESLLTAETDEVLAKKDTKYRQKVNKAIAFNAIKQHAFALFLSTKSLDTIFDELIILFTKTPISIRLNKNPPRTNKAERQRLNFWKRRKKMVF